MYGVAILVFHLAMGGITQAMAEKKGKSKSWFWIGFFFGVIGPVIMALYLEQESRGSESRVGLNRNIPEKNLRNLQMLRKRSGWTSRSVPETKNEMISDPTGCDILAQYRRLMEADVITPGEYEAKKKKIREQEEWNRKLSQM